MYACMSCINYFPMEHEILSYLLLCRLDFDCVSSGKFSIGIYKKKMLSTLSMSINFRSEENPISADFKNIGVWSIFRFQKNKGKQNYFNIRVESLEFENFRVKVKLSI